MEIKDESVLDQFRGKNCEWCSKGPGEPHHLFARGMGGGSRLDIRINLVALCRRCHSMVHSGEIIRVDLLAVVAQRENRLQHEMMEEIYETIRQCGKDRAKLPIADRDNGSGKDKPVRGSISDVGKRDRQARMENNEDESGRLSW